VVTGNTLKRNETMNAAQAQARKSPLAEPQRRRVTILGSTGSVGCQTIDLISRAPEKYDVVALTARKNVAKLVEQAKLLKPELAVIADESQYAALKEALAGTNIAVAAGAEAVVDAARIESDWVMSAIVGAAGLPGTLAAARRGAVIAFANKETLVCAGPLMMKLAAECGAQLLPVDSEHNAIWQVFDFERRESISRLILTASGGPFRAATREEMAKMTPEQAVKHPVWAMGAKISVDSASLMNKALEVIEAHFLFAMPPEKIDVVVHPQSVIHSMVEYEDGSVLAQMGSPDMRTPIGYCLAWPQRMETPAAKLDFAKLGQLTFEAPDPVKFPALRFAREAMAKGGTAPAVLNAANEVAVQAFLDKRIGFLDIERINEETLNAQPTAPLTDLDVLHKADEAARRYAEEQIGKRS
jgi:1-deoxy-D-xylulose-5-phosphate reductoisomerase